MTASQTITVQFQRDQLLPAVLKLVRYRHREEGGEIEAELLETIELPLQDVNPDNNFLAYYTDGSVCTSLRRLSAQPAPGPRGSECNRDLSTTVPPSRTAHRGMD